MGRIYGRSDDVIARRTIQNRQLSGICDSPVADNVYCSLSHKPPRSWTIPELLTTSFSRGGGRGGVRVVKRTLEKIQPSDHIFITTLYSFRSATFSISSVLAGRA